MSPVGYAVLGSFVALVTLALLLAIPAGCSRLPEGVMVVDADAEDADAHEPDTTAVPADDSINTRATPPEQTATNDAAPPLTNPAHAITTTPTRVGGDTAVSAAFEQGQWRSGRSYIDSPLPDQYADPTPPGAIDLKRYPSTRRAQITATGVTQANARRAGNGLFMPLFRHIQRHDIAMTAPVESEYRMTHQSAEVTGSSESSEAGEPRAEMSMAFLYRQPELGPTGVDEADERIEVIDTDEVIVLSIGYTGPYGMSRSEEHRRQLLAWLGENSQWELDPEANFDIRVLGYNGPYTPRAIRWSEFQVPVRPAAR